MFLPLAIRVFNCRPSFLGVVDGFFTPFGGRFLCVCAALTAQLAYLSNLTSLQAKGGKVSSAAAAAAAQTLASLRLPADLHVVAGQTARSGTPPTQGKASAAAAAYRQAQQQQQQSTASSSQQAAAAASLYLSSYNVPNNQIYQVRSSTSSAISSATSSANAPARTRNCCRFLIVHIFPKEN